jgi:serine protease AprX
MHSLEIDEFVSRNRDMLVVVAAGNEGRADRRDNTSPGVVDWLSIASPGTAKNALTVGASRSDRNGGGFSKKTWRDYASKFPDAPIGDEKVSGDPESLAAFSSRGPVDDRRIKPDVVAPGTDIVSTKASSAPDSNFWEVFQPNSKYAYWGGTSMAAPLVAGCAALVRQYYIEQHNHHPSAALLRATIINGTRWLGGRDANESNPANTIPPGNYDQGFGCVNMATTIPNPDNPGFSLVFFDNWESLQRRLTRTDNRQRFALQVQGGTMLRICLAYTDEPARGAQNILTLIVQKPDVQKQTGNHRLRNALTRTDHDNNVQVVRIASPAIGPYLIQIEALTLLQSPQDFALVVAGEFGTARLQPMD